MTHLDLDIRNVVWVGPCPGETRLCTDVDQLDKLTNDSPLDLNWLMTHLDLDWLMTHLDLDIRNVVWVDPGSGDTGLCADVDQLDKLTNDSPWPWLTNDSPWPWLTNDSPWPWLTYDSPWPWHQKCSLSWAWPWWHRTLCQCRSAWLADLWLTLTLIDYWLALTLIDLWLALTLIDLWLTLTLTSEM